MTGYTPDEKLRFEQIVKLRRQWLKDQELSPREPVVTPKPSGPVARFWANFLEPKTLWRLYVSLDSQHVFVYFVLVVRNNKNTFVFPNK